MSKTTESPALTRNRVVNAVTEVWDHWSKLKQPTIVYPDFWTRIITNRLGGPDWLAIAVMAIVRYWHTAKKLTKPEQYATVAYSHRPKFRDEKWRLSIKEIAAQLNVSKSSVSKAVARLEELHLLEREHPTKVFDDGVKTYLYVTPKVGALRMLFPADQPGLPDKSDSTYTPECEEMYDAQEWQEWQEMLSWRAEARNRRKALAKKRREAVVARRTREKRKTVAAEKRHVSSVQRVVASVQRVVEPVQRVVASFPQNLDSYLDSPKTPTQNPTHPSINGVRSTPLRGGRSTVARRYQQERFVFKFIPDVTEEINEVASVSAEIKARLQTRPAEEPAKPEKQEPETVADLLSDLDKAVFQMKSIPEQKLECKRLADFLRDNNSIKGGHRYKQVEAKLNQYYAWSRESRGGNV